ncbi:hypothetical protein T643_A5550 [Klebsiella pneumoniae MRSN 1319]|nr:hypothetical protein T643_A5550 [Klebsiella pneumoniae MRSN 1319]
MILRLMINITFSMILFAWFDYHILCVFSATQIRKDAVPDLIQPRRRAAAQKHKM